MELSIPVLMAESWWYVLPRRFPGVDVDAFVVMPNHVHGILAIGTDPELEMNTEPGTVIGWYKSITAHDYGIGVTHFEYPAYVGRFWQKNSYERILRDARAVEPARAYIDANPANWHDDEENPLRDGRNS